MSDMLRDAAEFNEASELTDPAISIDTLEDHVSELVRDLARGMPEAGMRKLINLVVKVVKKLLNEGRLSALVDVERLEGRELMAQLIAEIIDDTEPRLMARCIDFTFSLGVQLGLNETKIAAKENVTKASASGRCVYLKGTYLLGKPAPGMKSTNAVEKYRQNRTGKSSRSAVVEWQLGASFKAAYERTA